MGGLVAQAPRSRYARLVAAPQENRPRLDAASQGAILVESPGVTRMLDRSFIGHRTGPVIYEVERWHVQRFAAALGDSDPVYRDEAIAKARGLRGIPVPPTFVASLRPEDPRADLRLDFRRVLHGEQRYEYLRPLCVGDVVHVTARIVDLYEKPGRTGRMGFIVMEVEGRSAQGEPYYLGRQLTVVRG